MNDREQRPSSPPNRPESAVPADESFSKWSQTEDDEDLEVFVVGADEEQAPAAPPPELAVDLPSTMRDEDVDGDEWKDQAWLAELDDFDELAADTPAPPRGSPSTATPPPAPDVRPTGDGFVDAGALPDRPATSGEDDEDRFQEVIQTLASAATDETSARRVANADTAELLRELSMLSVDG